LARQESLKEAIVELDRWPEVWHKRVGSTVAGVKRGDSPSQVAQSGKILGTMTGSGHAFVFGESDIPDVVGLVFDFPVTAPELLELSGAEFPG
jgi:hypothetical protein